MHFGSEDANVVAELRLLRSDPSTLLSPIDVFGGFHEHHAEADHCKPPNVFKEVEEVLRLFLNDHHFRTEGNKVVVEAVRHNIILSQ